MSNWRESLALERNVAAAAGAVFLLGFGEELWKRFVPKYLEALGAGAVAVGLYGAAEDLFDAVYQFPGGTVADRLGRRRAFPLFIAVASVGYLVYLLGPSWPWVFAGLALAMGWNSMASPATFAVIADALPRGRRAMGFTVQSILRRVPRLISPLVGGALIGAFGIVAGMRIGFAATLLLAGLTLLIVSRMDLPFLPTQPMRMRGVWRTFDPPLKRLLVSDVVIRTCEGMAGVFVILYVTTVRGFSVPAFSLLLALQVATSLLIYLPAARLADRIGRKPFVTATFLAFALFPVTVALASGSAAMALAFVVGGLREIGEPSRKAMIVDSAGAEVRGRTVGLYYLVRGLSVTPAAVIGGLLWRVSPATPFFLAGAIGLAGTALFVATVEERYAA
jgi:MFS family permease